jgi:flagellin-like protein
MKGISPMIATILLIAFTVAVGGIISVWLTGFTRTTTGGTEVKAEALTRCSTCGFEVISVKKDSQNFTYVTHYGSGITLYPISVVFDTGDTVTSFGANSDSNVTAGQIAKIDLTTNFPSNAAWLKVTALCEYGGVNASAPVVAECRKGDRCWPS